MAPEQNPSKFVTELIRDFKNVKVNGKINKVDDSNPANIKLCPICGFPLQLRYKPHYGLKLWLCSNEPGHIIFEYDIPRLGKRIDVVLILRGIIFCLEFKVGQK